MSNIDSFLKTLDKMTKLFSGISQNIHASYKWLTDDEYESLIKVDLSTANKMYWQEMIERIQFCSIAGLLRTLDWLNGMKRGIEDENYLIFASSFRGALESAGDIWDSLRPIPDSLAENHKLINLALLGEYSEKLFISSEIDNTLTNFAFAGNKSTFGTNNIRLQPPKSNKDYIKSLDKDNEYNLLELYYELCNMTHPAHFTVLGLYKETEKGIEYKNSYHIDWILYLIEKYSNVFVKVMMNPINLCLINLWCVDRFDYSTKKYNLVEKLDLSDILLWQNISKKFST